MWNMVGRSWQAPYPIQATYPNTILWKLSPQSSSVLTEEKSNKLALQIWALSVLNTIFGVAWFQSSQGSLHGYFKKNYFYWSVLDPAFCQFTQLRI